MTDFVKNQLQHILNQSNINHSVEILKEESVKNAHIYCKINQLSGQVTGPLIESYLKEKYIMRRLPNHRLQYMYLSHPYHNS